MNQLLSTGCILVENADAFTNFVTQVFEGTKFDNLSKPLRHTLINICDGCKLLLVQKQHCSQHQFAYLQPLFIRHVSIATQCNIDDIQKYSLQAGGRIMESNNDSSYCIFEGPEGIVFFVTDANSNNQKSWFNDILISSIPHASSSTTAPTNSSSVEAQASSLTQSKQKTVPSLALNLRTIPTLEASIFSGKGYVPFAPNSREPTPFETDVFKGHAMLVVRTTPIDPHFAAFFEGKRRRFEVQVQGKFKFVPEGEVYVGAEGSNKMELGLITRSISKAACNLASTMASNLHYAFGDEQNPITTPLYQLPHMVSPLFPTFDKVIATPPGETPPKLGEPFIEDPEYRKLRCQWMLIADANIDLNTTYSFSVNTSNLDLATWCIMNIPMVRPMDVRNFFGDSSISLVGYEIPKATAANHPNIHPKLQINYFFSIKLTPVEADMETVLNSPVQQEQQLQPSNGEAVGGVAVDGGGGGGGYETDGGSGGEGGNTGERTKAVRIRRDDQKVIDNGRGGEEEDDGEEDDEEGGQQEDELMGEGQDEYIGADYTYNDESDDVDDERLRATSSIFPQKLRFRTSKVDKGNNTVGSWLRRRIDDMTPDALDVPETTEVCPVDYEMEAMGDLRFCPMSINIIDRRLMKNRRRRTIYLLPWSAADSTATAATNSEDTLLSTTYSYRFRAYSEVIKFMPMVPIPRMFKNRKFSSDEKKRRQIVESYKLVLTRGIDTQVETNMNTMSPIDLSFLESHHEPTLVGKKNALVTSGGKNRPELIPKWQGGVCMAISSRHWSEYIVRINKHGISVSLSPESLRISYSIPAKSIFCIRPICREETPLIFVNGFGFFQIETFSRIYYFMVKEKWLTIWLQILSSIFGSVVRFTTIDTSSSTTTTSSSTTEEIIYRFPEPAEASYYVARPSSWRLDKRRIFNFRKIIFHSKCIPSKYSILSPNQLMEEILQSAFALAAAEAKGCAEASRWVHFFDAISVLQNVDFSNLNERERVAFLLNLYHLMVVHGSIIMGPCPSWVSWQGFFNTSYLLSYDVVSINEVEYNMLRASMTKPSPLLSKISIPNSHYPGLALTQRDFRLNFCINCGSKSSPYSVPIYKADGIDRQMDEYTSLMLTEFVRVDFSKSVVTLPKICSLFQSDFATRRLPSPTTMDCLRTLLPYLKSDHRQLLIRLCTEGTNITVRFLNYDFRCNHLKLQR